MISELKKYSFALEESLGWITTPLIGKKPILKDWTKQITTKNIHHAWNGDNVNIGLLTGKVSGVIVLDIDNKDNGVEDWLEFIACNGEPNTYKVATGGGGYHYYFKYTDKVSHLKSSSRVVTLNDRKLAWDIKTDGGQVVIPPSIHPDTHKPYECVNCTLPIEMPDWILHYIDDSNKSNKVQPTKITKLVISPSETQNNLTSETLSDLLSRLKIDRADNYDSWLKVIWAIKSVSIAYQDLAHEFSARSSKYDADAVDKVWNTNTNRDDVITVASLFHWLKEDIGVEEYKLFRKNHDLDRKTRSSCTYSPYDDYYLSDYIHDNNNKVFSNKEAAYNYLIPLMMRIGRGTYTANKPTYYFKECSKNPFASTKVHPSKLYSNKFSYSIETDEGEFKTVEQNLLSVIVSNTDLFDREIDWKPYHAHLAKPDIPNKFNIFPGFRARFIPNFGPEEYKEIELLLTHISTCMCDDDKDLYKYIISLLAHPFRTLTRTNKVPVLIGTEGIGKTMILEFIGIYIYGPSLYFSAAGLDKFTQKFNGGVADKMFSIVAETDSVDNYSHNNTAAFNKMKDNITADMITIERKGVDPIMIENYNNINICSNNDFAVYLTNTDRRYFPLRCSDRYRGNLEYFTSIRKLFNQRIANLLYTYFLSEDILPYLVEIDIVPMTQMKLEIIAMSRSRSTTFTDALLSGEVVIHRDYIKIIDKNKIFILSSSIYSIFKDWFKDRYPSSKIVGEDKLIHDLKINCKHVTYDRIQNKELGGRKRGFFINESVYDTVFVDISTDPLRRDNKYISLRVFLANR